MLRWAFIGSYVLFNLVLIPILWGNAWLPHAIGVAITIALLVGWFVSAYFLFKRLQLTMRQKIVGWLFIAAVAGYGFARQVSSYELLAQNSWSMWLVWRGLGLLVVIATFVLVAVIVGKRQLKNAATYTVESETPDHVIHLASKPNQSFNATG